ncbi:MAG: hypothetical protein WD066_17160 [Planctomycetaceae bacterium]
MKFWLIASLCLSAGSSAGCQCHPCARDCYSGVIDCANDHAPVFDRLYHPAFDLTRIGQPDWCACPLNRAICGPGCGCKECCR